MEGVQGGAQQFQSIQTQTDSAFEVRKSHTRDSVRQVEAQSTAGLTDPGKVKHISLKTRIVNFLNNKWTPISAGVKAKVVENVENPSTKEQLSRAIDIHNEGVVKLKALKDEKTQLESKVKELEKDKTFMKMVGIATRGRVLESDCKKGSLVLIRGGDGQITEKSFKYNDRVTNVKNMVMAVQVFGENKQFSEYTESLTRIKDITQERADLKESLRGDGKQMASDLKSDARQQHQDLKKGLSDLTKSKVEHARDQFTKKLQNTKSVYEESASAIKTEKKSIDGELKELRKQRYEARSEVRKGLADKWSSWHNKNIGAIVSRLTPKGVTVASDSLKNERITIKASLDVSRHKVKELDQKIESKKKEKKKEEDKINDERKQRDDNLKVVKEANKDVAKALKGNAVKGDRKRN